MNEINAHLAAIQQEIGREFNNNPSPFTHWLRPIVKSAESGALILEYLVRKDMTNPMQVLHVGVSAGIDDDIIGATIFSMNLSHHYTKINNYIDYLAPANEGDIVEARSSIVKRDKQIINLQCELWLPARNCVLFQFRIAGRYLLWQGLLNLVLFFIGTGSPAKEPLPLSNKHGYKL